MRLRFAIGLAFTLTTLFTACSEYNLSPLKSIAPNAVSKGSFCTYDPISRDSSVNYMFIMDISGSNSSTDPGSVRMQKMMEFYDRKKVEPNTKWGALEFNDRVKASIYDPVDPNQPIFTDDLSISDPQLQTLSGKRPGGGTNYSDSLSMAKSAIEFDFQQNSGRDDYYMIFFISDGQPESGDTSESGILRRVDELVNLRSGRIFLSTAYYGNYSSNLLRKMAERGGGQFQEIEAGDLDFDDLIVGPTREAWVLKNDAFFVYNLNSAICERAGYTYQADSDGDGMCDLDEDYYNGKPDQNGKIWYFDKTKRSTLQLNANGQLYDTGYGDYFHLAAFKSRTTLPACNNPEDRLDKDLDLLNKCEEQVIINLTPYGTQYKEKIWTMGNPKDPDTDNDGIIDALDLYAFRSRLDFSGPTDDRVSRDLDGEGLSVFKQVQEHRNPLKFDKDQPAYDVVLTELESGANGKSCFDYQQTRLPLHSVVDVSPADVHPMLARGSNENVVLVYYVQTKFRDPNGKGIYMHSFQRLKVDANFNGAAGTTGGLQVNDRVFTPYETYLRIDELD